MKKILLVAFLAIAGMTISSNAQAQVIKEVTNLPRQVRNTLEQKLFSLYGGQHYSYSFITKEFLVKVYYFNQPIFHLEVLVNVGGVRKIESAYISPSGVDLFALSL
jgi:hypothetical protein